MNAHPHFDWSRVPGFMLQGVLRIERGLERIAGSVKGRAEGIARDLKDVPVVCLNGLMQDFVMPREEDWQFGRILLRQRGAALDVGEKKCDGAAR
jgi:hypothetical protein